ncbi:hypothetical protein MVAC_12386 [Mycolicibacterium vaccae ATCC 25954]|uniref:Uncharacterized protein n=1 Tax=Mycolicibacterium vaccae ATCC 25954 TaxID=1194972 RepID=K0VEJ9_MYCVA|nr:hypothetical protein MVAC_12386 [Mycolicibacterium vaccae ATCC 25954]
MHRSLRRDRRGKDTTTENDSRPSRAELAFSRREGRDQPAQGVAVPRLGQQRTSRAHQGTALRRQIAATALFRRLRIMRWFR